MSRRVLRYEVPVDDQWHRIEFAGTVAHVASRQSGVVEFWAAPSAKAHMVSNGMGQVLSVDYREYDNTRAQWFRVYGTGHEADGLWCGTTFDAATTALVWHLFSRDAEPTA